MTTLPAGAGLDFVDGYDIGRAIIRSNGTDTARQYLDRRRPTYSQQWIVGFEVAIESAERGDFDV